MAHQMELSWIFALILANAQNLALDHPAASLGILRRIYYAFKAPNGLRYTTQVIKITLQKQQVN